MRADAVVIPKAPPETSSSDRSRSSKPQTPGRRGVPRSLRRLTPYLLILPAVVLIAFFIYGMVNGVLQGFGIAPYIGKQTFTLEYYAKALTEPTLLGSLQFSFYLAALSTAGSVLIGVALSAAICRVGNARRLQLFGIQVPMMTAHMVVVLGMLTLFSSAGLIARILFACGIIADPNEVPSILGATSGWGIILVYLWREAPYVAFCTLTIMMNIGGSYNEAAASLGAGSLRTFFAVTLPLCKSAIIRAALIVFTYVFGSYEVAALLGPSQPRALPVLAYYEFKMVDITNRSYAMALDGIAIAICLVVTIVYFILLRRERKGES